MSAAKLRPAVLADLPVMVRHRLRMLEDMGLGSPDDLVPIGPNFAIWATAQIAAGTLWTWFIEVDGVVAARASVWRKPRLPTAQAADASVAFVFNVYCERHHRRHGYARRLMDHIVAWAPSAGFDVVELHASDEGRPLYASMGFAATNEMRLHVS
ncbi:MAG: N-acetyltransferase family protein [Dehalococcoidia bacterium]